MVGIVAVDWPKLIINKAHLQHMRGTPSAIKSNRVM